MAIKSASPAAPQILDEIGLGDIPSSWNIIRIEELLSEDRGISVGVMYPGDHDPIGVPLIKAGDLANGRINPRPEFRITLEKHHEYRRTQLKGGELLISLVGDVGRCAIVPSEMSGWNAARAIAVLRFVDPSDAAFVRACLMSAPLQHLMQAWATTTVQATLNLKEIRQIPLPWPPSEQRKAIAHILGTLDDKIELNRRMNETLEAIARALFKSWFVDFEPIRAKAQGRDPGLPKHLADLFPDSFEDSELGEIPKGWRVVGWGTLVSLEYGKNLRDYDRRNEAYPVYGTNGMIGSHSRPLCDHPGIIIGRKGAYRGVHFCSTPFFVIDTAFYVEPKEQIESRWAYYELLRQDINSMDSGSAIPSTSREDFYNLEVLYPPFKLQQAFAELLSPFWARQEHNNRESGALAGQRDTLLPKLISGELRLEATNNQLRSD